MTTQDPLSFQQIVPIAILATACVTVVSTFMKWGMEYLTAKFGKNTVGQEIAAHTRAMAEQSADCRFDHKSIHSLILGQNVNFEKMLEHQGRMIDALTTMDHKAEIRHNSLLESVRRIEERVKS